MKLFNQKLLTHIFTSTFGGTVFGIIGFLTLMNFGGNYGCHPFIDFLFKSRGYESCGSFGLYAGILIGVILVLFFINRRKFAEKTYLKINKIFELVTLFIVFNFLLLVAFMGSSALFLPLTIGIFILYSLIPASILSFIVNMKK